MQEAKANARGRKSPATAEKVSSVSRVALSKLSRVSFYRPERADIEVKTCRACSLVPRL